MPRGLTNFLERRCWSEEAATPRPKSATLRFPLSYRSRFSDESISENSLPLAARSSMKWTFLLIARISCSWSTWWGRRHRRMAVSRSMLFLPLSEAHGLCFSVSSRRAAAGMPPPAQRCMHAMVLSLSPRCSRTSATSSPPRPLAPSSVS
jgi:hypothetical protein